MNKNSTQNKPEAAVTAKIWCQGCKIAKALSFFLHQVDDICSKLNLQCTACLSKSKRYYEKHQQRLAACRVVRRLAEKKTTCQCGAVVRSAYHAKHVKTKRHLTIVSLLNKSAAQQSKSDITAKKTEVQAEPPRGPTPQHVALLAPSSALISTNLSQDSVKRADFYCSTVRGISRPSSSAIGIVHH